MLPPFMVDDSGYGYPTTWELVGAPHLRPWYGPLDIDGHVLPHYMRPLPWHGQTVVCLASGPSLTPADCEQVHRAGHITLATNDTWRLAPWARILYATDPGWWQQHNHELTHTRAQRWTNSISAAKEMGLNLHVSRGGYGNSGALAALLAMDMGASRVILLGYDCSLEAGTHWHGDHVRTGNPTSHSIRDWAAQFEALSEEAKARSVAITNCSRATSLTCFKRLPLEKALDKAKKMVALHIP